MKQGSATGRDTTDTAAREEIERPGVLGVTRQPSVKDLASSPGVAYLRD